MRVNPVKGHKGGEATGESYRQGELGRAGIVSLTWRGEGSDDLTSLCQCLRGGVKDEPNSSSKSRDGQEEESTSGNNRSST